MRQKFLIVALLAPLAAGAVGQDAPAPPRKPGEVEIQFANGSTVRMLIETEAIEVRTPYGTLAVPAKDVKLIEFGVHYSDEIEKQIDDAIRKLSAENFRDRDAATNTLLKIGADAYPAVHELTKTSADLETVKRAKTVLTTMNQKIPAKDLRLQYNDSVVTPTFTIAGRITTQTIKAKADYFGAVQLQVAQLRLLRSTETPSEINVNVDAGKYGSRNSDWMTTDLTVDSRMRLVISANGIVNLRPNIPGAGMDCNPNGYNPNTGGFGSVKARQPGALMGRIGEAGTPFIIGESYDGVPGRDGKLQLQIVASPYNAESSGTYQVKIAVKH